MWRCTIWGRGGSVAQDGRRSRSTYCLCILFTHSCWREVCSHWQRSTRNCVWNEVIQPVLVGSQIRHPLGSQTIEHLFVQAWLSDFSVGISNDPEMGTVIRGIWLFDYVYILCNLSQWLPSRSVPGCVWCFSCWLVAGSHWAASDCCTLQIAVTAELGWSEMIGDAQSLGYPFSPYQKQSLGYGFVWQKQSHCQETDNS